MANPPLKKTQKNATKKAALETVAEEVETPDCGLKSSTTEIAQDDAPDFEAIAQEFEPKPEPEPEPEPEVDATGVAVEVDTTPKGFYTKDAFREGAGTYFRMAGGVTGLQTLLLSPDSPDYPKAMDALYETIVECPSLHFLITPQGVWMKRVAAIGTFAVPVALGCAGELKARKAEKEAKSANDNKPIKEEQTFKGQPEVMEEVHGNQVEPEIMTEDVAA